MDESPITNKLAVLTAIIGLLADAITIGGLAIGFVDPASLPLPGSAHGTVAVVTLAVLFYCLAVICCSLLILYEKRIRAAGIQKRDTSREATIALIIAYALWTPPYALWLLYVYGPWSGFWAGVWLTVLMIGGILVGGLLLILLAAAFSDMLWPYADADKKEQTETD